jgi:RNA polymerase sigma-70 factor (ECF subfamily)
MAVFHLWGCPFSREPKASAPMPKGSLGPLLRYLRKITAVQGGEEITDAHWLSRFATLRDEAAFAELVHRHGSMVMGVCRRVLGDWHEAEDAFQATFLVLARKAGSVRKPERLVNWLYGVAFRTALKARGIRARRLSRTTAVMETPTMVEPKEISELGPILDEELSRLPAKYRTPIVLCYFEGKTHEEIAKQLGCSRETISTRMARGRERLRKRLVRRGVVLTAASLATALSEQAAFGSVTPVLADTTVKAAVLFAVGEAALAGTVSTQVIALTQGVIKAMMMSKLMNAALAVLALAVIGTGSGLLWQGLAAGSTPEDTQTAAKDNQKGQDKEEKEKADQPQGAANDKQRGQDLKPKDEKEKPAQPQAKIVAEQRAKQWREKLDSPTTFDIDPGTPLKEALGFIGERYRLTILINREAFQTDLNVDDIEGKPINLPKLVDVKLRTILRVILDQVQGDYYTTEDLLIVVPRTRSLLGEVSWQSIDVDFQQRPLSEALKELSDRTGVTVVLDARHQEKAKLQVTADLKNVPFLTAVRVLADMADLRPVAMDNLIYVTSKENAKAIEAEETRRKGTDAETKREEKAAPKEKKKPVPEKPAAPTP